MSFIVYDNSECKIFKTATDAWKYITPVLKDNPLLAANFHGFGPTVTNINNHVAVLREYDTITPWVDLPNYMRPKELA